jgi:hypothetical protein
LQVITTARLWQQSGHKPGYLPFGAALTEAEMYVDAAPEVRDLVAASRSRARWLRVFVGAAIVVLLSVIPLGYWIFQEYQKQVVIPKRQEAWKNILSSPTASASEKAQAIQGLARNNLPLDLTNVTLDDVALDGIDARRSEFVKFIGAHMNNVTVASSFLPNALFSQSQIVGGKFDKTSLEFSRFDEAMIADTTFSNASLYRSIFDRALFCGEVKFLLSHVRSASFRSVRFDGGRVPQFDGTAWWLAVGWSMQQIQTLAARPSGVDYKDSPVFKNENAVLRESAQCRARAVFSRGGVKRKSLGPRNPRDRPCRCGEVVSGSTDDRQGINREARRVKRRCPRGGKRDGYSGVHTDAGR